MNCTFGETGAGAKKQKNLAKRWGQKYASILC